MPLPISEDACSSEVKLIPQARTLAVAVVVGKKTNPAASRKIPPPWRGWGWVENLSRLLIKNSGSTNY
jgi:hypothetical protein